MKCNIMVFNTCYYVKAEDTEKVKNHELKNAFTNIKLDYFMKTKVLKYKWK